MTPKWKKKTPNKARNRDRQRKHACPDVYVIAFCSRYCSLTETTCFSVAQIFSRYPFYRNITIQDRTFIPIYTKNIIMLVIWFSVARHMHLLLSTLWNSRTFSNLLLFFTAVYFLRFARAVLLLSFGENWFMWKIFWCLYMFVLYIYVDTWRMRFLSLSISSKVLKMCSATPFWFTVAREKKHISIFTQASQAAQSFFFTFYVKSIFVIIFYWIVNKRIHQKGVFVEHIKDLSTNKISKYEE